MQASAPMVTAVHYRKDSVQAVLMMHAVGLVTYLQCFDTVGWATVRTSGP